VAGAVNRTAACRATACRAEATGAPSPDWLPHAESSSPAHTAATTATVAFTVLAVRGERIFRLVSAVLASIRGTAVLRIRFVTHSDDAVT
jgi:hypothetical protein